MTKPFWIPFIVASCTIILLYGIGTMANIEAFKFELSPSYTEISLIPILIGLVMGFISERIVKYKRQTA